MNVAHHYTTGTCLAGIRAAGEIRPATAGVPTDEIPIVWFSRLDRWEPTATKTLACPTTGYSRTATLPEMHRMAAGLWRLTVDAALLMPWPQLADSAGMDRRMRAALERTARRQGAHPNLWMGHLGALPLSIVQRIEPISDRGMPELSGRAA